MINKSNKMSIFLEKVILKILYRLWNLNCDDFKKNGEYYFLKSLIGYYKKKKNITIFDCGANTGKYSKSIQEIANSNRLEVNLHLFEPMKKTFNELVKNINQKNVFLNNLGVSDINENRNIYFDNEQSSLASIYHRQNLENFNLKKTISLIKLSDYLKTSKVNHIHLLKLDVEGHEFFALKGLEDYLNKDFIDFILFEYGGTYLDSKTTLRAMYGLLNHNGFTIARLMKRGLKILDYNSKFENFQYANYVAISKRILLDGKIKY